MRDKKKELKILIARQKRLHWRNLLIELEDDIWGQAYGIVTKSLKVQTQQHEISLDRKREILRDLFPHGGPVVERKVRTASTVEEFTPEELEDAIKSLKNGRTPGPDGVTVEAWKMACRKKPHEILGMYNDLLNKRIFPKSWKKAKVVLIPKAGRDPSLSSSYRPICLLDVAGKMFETLLTHRLDDELEEKGIISPRQHGFVKKKSTVTAMTELMERIRGSNSKWAALVTVDVRNAFNSVWWPCIVDRMRLSGLSSYLVEMTEEYFRDRWVQSGPIKLKCSMGVPQGSVKGPRLWVVVYDEVLILNYGDKVTALGYADDLLFLVEDESEDGLKSAIERSVQMASEKMRPLGLQLAPQKTEVMIVKGPRKRIHTSVRILGTEVGMSRTLKYLGVTYDVNMTFAAHIELIVKKASQKVESMRRLLPYVGDPSYSKRRILCSILHSVVTYAAPVWRGAMKKGKYRDKLLSIQRRGLLRVASAYRTVSGEAAQVISGYPPIDLLIAEKCFLFRVGSRLPGNRRMARRRTISKWQERWEAPGERAQWTKRLIPDVAAWVECKHKKTNYFFTQFLSGHGSFGTFTKKINKTEDDLCHECGDQDSPEHVYTDCTRWANERNRVCDRLGILPQIDDMIPEMLNDSHKWDTIFEFLVEVMTRKETEDRSRQRE